MQITTLLAVSWLPLSSSQFPPISFHHCFSFLVTGDGIAGTKSYTVLHSEDIRRRSNNYFPRTPFLFLINYPKQIYKVLRNFHCTAQYPLNQTPPTGWTWGKLRLKKPTQSDVSPVIRRHVGHKMVFIAHYHIEIQDVCGFTTTWDGTRLNKTFNI